MVPVIIHGGVIVVILTILMLVLVLCSKRKKKDERFHHLLAYIHTYMCLTSVLVLLLLSVHCRVRTLQVPYTVSLRPRTDFPEII